MDKLRLNIGIVGCVSVGKTTLTNAIFGCQYSDTEIHRTTFIPQIYQETDEVEIEIDESINISNIRDIRTLNQKSNQTILEVLKNGGDNKFPTHSVSKITNFFNYDLADQESEQNSHPNSADDQIVSQVALRSGISPEFREDSPRNNADFQVALRPGISPDIFFTLTDYPGIEKLNGPYLELVQQHIQKSDIIVFVTDLSKALMTIDEINILKFLLGLLSKTNIRIICLLNKCDGIYYDTVQNDLVFMDNEHERIYIRTNNILHGITKSMCISADRYTPFIPISSEIAFVYRAIKKYPTVPLDETYINKLCVYEYGSSQWKKNYENIRNLTSGQIVNLFNNEINYSQKMLDSGFNAFRSIIEKIIVTYEKEFFVQKTHNIINKLLLMHVVNISDLIGFINENFEFIKICSERYACNLVDSFWNTFQTVVQKYTDHIKNYNVNITVDQQLISFDLFDNMHTNLQTECLYFKSLIETVQKIRNNRIDSSNSSNSSNSTNSTNSSNSGSSSNSTNSTEHVDLTIHFRVIVDKLITLYEQLITHTDGMDRHTHFSNILHYLSIVHEYAPENFDKLSVRFLDVFPKKIKMIISNDQHSQEKKLVEVIDYIYKNTIDIVSLYKKLSYILIVKHMYMITHFSPEKYWYNMVMLKNYIKKNRTHIPLKSKYFVDIIYEITTKYIRDQLTDKGVFNVYRQEINMDLVSTLLRTPEKYDLAELGNLEKKIMEILFDDS